MQHLMNNLLSLVRDDCGQDLIEYALLAGFVSLIVVAVVTNLGATVNEIYGGSTRRWQRFRVVLSECPMLLRPLPTEI